MTNIPLRQTDTPVADSVTPIDPAQVDAFTHLVGAATILEADLPDYDDIFELHQTTYSIESGLIELVREDVTPGGDPYFAPKNVPSTEAFQLVFNVPNDQSERLILKAADPAAAVTKYDGLGIQLTFEEDDGTPIAP